MIVLLETVHPDAHDLLQTAGEVLLVGDPPSLDEDLEADRVRALITRGRGRITAGTFDRLPNLEVVARCGAGLDNVDTEAAASAGVVVAHAPGSTTHAVAEHALMLMLSLARRLVALDGAVKRDDWASREGYLGVEMRGKRLGVIGLGAIGTRVAELGRVLGMDVVGTTRRDHDWVPRVSLAELLGTSDVIQVCVALTDDTRGLLGPAQFASMKPGALLVNTARGPIVDHAALGQALAGDTLGGYAADVWDPEPPGDGDASAAHPRTLVTPHVAGLTDVTYREICVRTVEAVVEVLTGGLPDPACIFGATTP